MPVSEIFRSMVASGDLVNIRLALCNSLTLDTSFREFAEMEELAANVAGLYVPYDNIPMDTDDTHWDDEYLGLQQVKLEANFCPERIAHVKAIASKLHPPKTSSQANQGHNASAQADWGRSSSSSSSRHYSSSYEEQKRKDASSGRIVKIVAGGGAGAIVGGVVGAVAGSMGGPVVIGTLVGCGVGYVISKR